MPNDPVTIVETNIAATIIQRAVSSEDTHRNGYRRLRLSIWKMTHQISNRKNVIWHLATTYYFGKESVLLDLPFSVVRIPLSPHVEDMPNMGIYPSYSHAKSVRSKIMECAESLYRFSVDSMTILPNILQLLKRNETLTNSTGILP